MDKEDLLRYKEELAKAEESATEEEKNERLLYLKHLADGTLQGPPVGHSSIDRTELRYYTDEEILKKVPEMSIYQYLLENTKDFDDKLAFEYFNKKITFGEFKRQVELTKKALVAQGLKQGDVVSICLPNMPEVGYLFYALNDLGIVANMLDPRTNSSGLCQSVDDSKSNIVISLDSVVSSFTDSSAKKIISISGTHSLSPFVQHLVKIFDKSMRVKLPKDERIMQYSSFMKEGKNITEVPKVQVNPDDPAVIAYTGGTTGPAKGVIMTNRAFNSMVVENSVAGYNAAPGDTVLGMAPPWTYYGLSNSFNAYLSFGIDIKLIPKFGPDDLGMLVKKNRPNHIISVPSALVGMMNDKSLENEDLSFIKTIIVGADKLSTKLEEEFNQFLEAHNCTARVSKGYGMTEVCAAAAYTMKETNTPGTVGIPFLYENIAVFNPEDPNEELVTGQSGEIAILGPKNMVGYFGTNEGKTGAVLKQHSDGTVWAHTGDLGHRDADGKLYIDGRLKRMFVKAGFKIFPGEIENQILKHPGVEQAAVVAAENESMGFVISAYVTLNKNVESGNEDDIINEINTILRANVYDYEIPDAIKVIDHMPLTGMNKINYRELETMAKEDMKEVSVRKV